MRIDHIENFNLACATVGKLAAEAIAEHRRQIEQLETVGREAAKLVREQPREEARKIDLPRVDVDSSLTLSVPSFDDRLEATPVDASAQPEEHIEDMLSVAMHRADREPDPAAMHLDNLRRRRAAEFASAKDNRAAEALDETAIATPVEHHGADGDEDVLARGRELVSSLRKRGRR